MKKPRLKRWTLFIAFFVIAFIVFSAIVMALWNAILPDVTGVKSITFIQAMGILLLSKILFAGFGPRGGRRIGKQNEWRNKIREKFASMTDEERQQFRSDWRNRCGGRDQSTDNRDRTDTENYK